MRQTANLTNPLRSETALRKLADMFPNAMPLRISISVSIARGQGRQLKESAMIEFGTSMMVFFESRLPLEMKDTLRLENSDGSLGADAVVVAVRDGINHRAVAARFVSEPRNWVIQG